VQSTAPFFVVSDRQGFPLLVRAPHLRHSEIAGAVFAFDFLHTKFCFPFPAGHWDGRDTVVVHIAFNWLGRFPKPRSSRAVAAEIRADSDLPLVAILTSASIAVAPCWRISCWIDVFCRFLSPATGIARLPLGQTADTCRVH
jgi:hypothetical protein